MAWQRWHICPLLSPEWWPCQNVLPCSQSTAWALLLHIWAGSIIGVTLTILMHYEGALRCTCWLLCGIARPQLITVEIASFWNLLACNFCWKGGVITSFTARALFFFFLRTEPGWAWRRRRMKELWVWTANYQWIMEKRQRREMSCWQFVKCKKLQRTDDEMHT